jgi:hypothetical protein
LLQLAQWFLRRRFLCEFPIGSYVKLSSAVGAISVEGPTAGHIFGREPSNDYLLKIEKGGIFYELWTFADFGRLCKLEKRGNEIKKNLLPWNYWANLNQILLKWFFGGPLPKLCPAFQNSVQDGHHSRT